jgi:cytochrome c-type biogenesis protein CcmH/NrfF
VPWWFWILAVLWSLPLLALLAAVAWECYDARLYEQMVQRRTAERRAEELVERESPLTTQRSNHRSRG